VLVDSTIWFTLPPLLVSTDLGTCSYQCFLSICTPVSLHMLKCSCAHTLILSFYVLFFCQYWACWYYVVCCLVKLLAKSALDIRLCVQYFCRIIFCLFIIILLLSLLLVVVVVLLAIRFRIQAFQNTHVKYSCCNSEFVSNVTKTDTLKIIMLIAVCRDVPVTWHCSAEAQDGILYVVGISLAVISVDLWLPGNKWCHAYILLFRTKISSVCPR